MTSVVRKYFTFFSVSIKAIFSKKITNFGYTKLLAEVILRKM